MPSRRENYPLTLLESLSAKVPVIASDVGGVRQMMIDNEEGYIFKSEDTYELKTKIEKVLEAPQLINTMRSNIRAIKTIEDNAKEINKEFLS